MNDLLTLDDHRLQRFADAVEASMSVFSRQQFFVWSQSALQSMLPHEILICGVREGQGSGLQMQFFSSSRYFRESHFAVMADPLHGLVPKLLSVFNEIGEASVLSEGLGERPSHQLLDALVAGNELRNLAARLVHGPGRQLEAVYAFARLDTMLDSRLLHALNVLTPHVHHTYVRVLQQEHLQGQPSHAREAVLVTQRQQEILRLVQEGKTNAEIALVLACSPWTVKNHIQNILRRLGSNSRTHAISRAMSLGILRPD
jgi:transcriptional regulator EpsA